MDLQTLAYLLFIPLFLFWMTYIILLKKLVLKISGKKSVSVWTGINKETGRLAVLEYKNKKEIVNELRLSQSLIFQVFFSRKLKEKYPSEVGMIRLIGILAWILFIIEVPLIFWVVIQANLR